MLEERREVTIGRWLVVAVVIGVYFVITLTEFWTA